MRIEQAGAVCKISDRQPARQVLGERSARVRCRFHRTFSGTWAPWCAGRLSACLILLLLNSGAIAEKRIPLLIGNQGFATEVGPLRNPLKDIHIVGAALAKVGFDILAPVKDPLRGARFR